jgi:hypothetical protein
MFQHETECAGSLRKTSILTFDQPRNLMMQMRNVYTLSSVCLVLSLSVFADEASEAVLSEVPKPVKNEQGQVVSPENMLSDAEDDKDDNIGELKKPDPIAIQPPKGRVPAGLVQMGEGEYFSKYAFLLDKSTRTLTIWQNTKNGPKLVEAHPADMGRRSGDKKVLGDKKTPEGIYFFRTIHEAEMLNYDEYGSRAYTMDYPNLFDVRARKNGLWNLAARSPRQEEPIPRLTGLHCRKR